MVRCEAMHQEAGDLFSDAVRIGFQAPGESERDAEGAHDGLAAVLPAQGALFLATPLSWLNSAPGARVPSGSRRAVGGLGRS
jgi:hypothetical protein